LHDYLTDWHDLWFQEKTGYIAVTDFQQTRFYGANDVPRVIANTRGQTDQYISINAFNVDWKNKKFSRRREDLKQIRNIAVDIDQYNIPNLSKEEAIEEVQHLTARGVIPRPNLINSSNGVQLFYNIEGGASPKMAWLASYITDQFIGKMKHIGADPVAKDMSRVMRVPNTINSKNNAIVDAYIYNDMPFTLDELRTYCKPLDEFRSRRLLRNEYVAVRFGTEMMNRTNYARLADLRHFIEARHSDLTGMRSTFIYVYSFHQSLVESTQANLFHKLESVRNRIYSKTDAPMSDREFYDTVKRANYDAGEFFEHIKPNGFKIDYVENDGIKKPYKSENLVKMFGIDDMPDSVQMEFRSIVTDRIRNEKDKARNEAYRRSKGVQPMETYQQERKTRQQAKIDELRALIAINPNMTKSDMAKELGVTRKHIYTLIKKV